jgi:hypothetical protein
VASSVGGAGRPPPIGYCGNLKNVGISSGTQELVKNLKNEYILLVQNDNPIANLQIPIQTQIEEAMFLLKNNEIDIMRLRHRWQVGEKFHDVNKYLRFFNPCDVSENFIGVEHTPPIYNIKNKFRWEFLRFIKKKQMCGRSVYLEKEPEKLFPKYIKKEGNIFIVDSYCINYTEQPFLCRKDFFTDVICKYVNSHISKRGVNGMQVFEIPLNCNWWRQQHFKIGIGEGIFTHKR